MFINIVRGYELKSQLAIKKESGDWHYDPMVPSTDTKYVGRIVNMNCSDILTKEINWGDVRVHTEIEDNNTDEWDGLDRMKLDWISYGYNDGNCQYQKVYDEIAPEYFHRIKKLCGLEHSNLQLLKQSPGQCLPWHFDTFKRQTDTVVDDYGDSIFGKEDFKRYVVFLEDWHWGHFLQFGNSVLYQWKAGDIYCTNYGMYHLSYNGGLVSKYTMNVTGLPNENSLHNIGEYKFSL